MRRNAMLAAALLSAVSLWTGASAAATGEPHYTLACKSLWTKLNNIKPTIEVSPVTDVFLIDTAKNTINGLPGVFSDTEIRWTTTGKNGETTTYATNISTGQFTVLSTSINPITGGPQSSQFDGQCERYTPQF